MKVFVQKILVTVVATDPNPASVAVTLDSQISNEEPAGKGVVLWSADALGNEPGVATIPDRPTDIEDLDADDVWMNEFVYPLLDPAVRR